jgi:hypothetical protein
MYSERRNHSPNTNPVLYHSVSGRSHVRAKNICISDHTRIDSTVGNSTREKTCDQSLDAVVKGFVAQAVAMDLINNKSHDWTTRSTVLCFAKDDYYN